jgi:hypothetical protein
LRALSQERARLYLAAVWDSWLDTEEAVTPETMQEAKSFAREMGLDRAEFRDRLMVLYPDLAREFLKQGTNQIEVEQEFANALEREIRAGRLSLLGAEQKLEELRRATAS